MPFGKTTNRSEEYWTFFNKYLIQPAVRNKPSKWSSSEWIEYDCARGIPKPANIMKELLKDLVNADLVLGVLTDRNANVWYELGIRHTLHKPTVMILEKNQDIPFDINQYGVVWYDNKIIRKSISIPIVSFFSYLHAIKWKWNYHKIDANDKKDKIYLDWHGAYRKDTLEGEIEEKIYFDIHGNEYRKLEGKSKLKVFLREYEEFKEQMNIFCQEKRNTADSPVMEFLTSDINIKIIAQKREIIDGEELEMRAEVKRRDCNPVPNVKVWFATSNSKVADFIGDYDERTDENGIVYIRLKAGDQIGETNVIVVAVLDDGSKKFDNKLISRLK